MNGEPPTSKVEISLAPCTLIEKRHRVITVIFTSVLLLRRKRDQIITVIERSFFPIQSCTNTSLTICRVNQIHRPMTTKPNIIEWLFHQFGDTCRPFGYPMTNVKIITCISSTDAAFDYNLNCDQDITPNTNVCSWLPINLLLGNWLLCLCCKSWI